MSFVVIEKQGPVAILKLNRPEAMNALGLPGDGDAVHDACAELSADASPPAAT